MYSSHNVCGKINVSFYILCYWKCHSLTPVIKIYISILAHHGIADSPVLSFDCALKWMRLQICTVSSSSVLVCPGFFERAATGVNAMWLRLRRVKWECSAVCLDHCETGARWRRPKLQQVCRDDNKTLAAATRNVLQIMFDPDVKTVVSHTITTTQYHFIVFLTMYCSSSQECKALLFSS